jgi:hypothetical protein
VVVCFVVRGVIIDGHCLNFLFMTEFLLVSTRITTQFLLVGTRITTQFLLVSTRITTQFNFVLVFRAPSSFFVFFLRLQVIMHQIFKIRENKNSYKYTCMYTVQPKARYRCKCLYKADILKLFCH